MQVEGRGHSGLALSGRVMRSVVLGTLLVLDAPSLRAQSGPSANAADPYARYVRPGQCVQAAQRLNKLYWRDKRADTVVYRPATDSVPATVVPSAKACAARFASANIPTRDLLGLVQLYLWTQQDTLAHATAERLVSANASQSVAERGWTLYQIVLSYLAAKPVRYDVVKSYLAQLDALGASATTAQMFAHTEASRYAISVDDIPDAIAQGDSAVGASTRMSKADRIDWSNQILDAYTVLAEPTAIQSGGGKALALFDRVSNELLPLFPPPSNKPSAPGQSGDRIVSGSNAMMTMAMMQDAMGGMDPQMMLRSSIDAVQQPYTIVDSTARPLQASHWYGVANDTSPRPKAGTVTLLVSVSVNCGGFCYPAYASIRRLYDAYHAAGLQIILMSSTAGYFMNQPAPAPADEAEKIHGYYLDFLKLPGVLGVDQTEFSHRADGRRVNKPGESRQDYFRNINCVVIGKDGKVHMVANLSPQREDAVSAAIKAALSK